MKRDAPIVTLKDEAGLSLSCYIEHSLEVEGKEYVLLLPVDATVEIFAWDVDEETQSDDEVLVNMEDEELNEIFPTARAVLEEQNLALHHTALTLTVTGEIPEHDEEDILTLDINDDDDDDEREPEQFQLLANFYHKDREYAIYTPLDPLLFFAQMNELGQPELLSPEEFQKIRPTLEDRLFDEMD